MSITLTEKAVNHLRAMSTRDNVRYFLRIRVKSGGCSGLRTLFSLEMAPEAQDVCFETAGYGVITDPLSLAFIKGAEVDYQEEMISAQFVLRNPGATNSCGCGESFSVF